MKPVSIPLNTPIRFVAMKWHEGWEFGCPTMLLYPVIRYAESGISPEAMIKEVGLDICVDIDLKRLIQHEDLSRELKFRGWTIEYLKRCARESLRGTFFPRKRYWATQRQIVFFRSERNGETHYLEVPK